MSLEDRFFAKVEPQEDGCHLWTAAKNNMGYGMFAVSKRDIKLAHRVGYEIANGPIPEGLVLDHLCRVPLCVNPEHLEAVSQAENVRRGNGGRHWREKTHCPQGHEYAGWNLYVPPSGGRYCRACISARNKAMRARKKAALAPNVDRP